METGLVPRLTPASPPRASERGDRRSEYLLVIYPCGEVRDRLLEEQERFCADYDPKLRETGYRAMGPHVTVAAFQAAEGMEDTLIRWIQRICHRYHRFELTLNNYSGMPPHTIQPTGTASGQGPAVRADRDHVSWQRVPGSIFLRVQDPQPFRRLMQQLRVIDHYVRSSGCPPVHLIDRPCLPIAAELTEQVFDRAMPDYSEKTFHESFSVDELVLLKRNHPIDPYRAVNIFRLLPDEAAGLSAGTLPHL